LFDEFPNDTCTSVIINCRKYPSHKYATISHSTKLPNTFHLIKIPWSFRRAVCSDFMMCESRSRITFFDFVDAH
jgi:hypothetical protein